MNGPLCCFWQLKAPLRGNGVGRLTGPDGITLWLLRRSWNKSGLFLHFYHLFLSPSLTHIHSHTYTLLCSCFCVDPSVYSLAPHPSVNLAFAHSVSSVMRCNFNEQPRLDCVETDFPGNESRYNCIIGAEYVNFMLNPNMPGAIDSWEETDSLLWICMCEQGIYHNYMPNYFDSLVHYEGIQSELQYNAFIIRSWLHS